MPSGESAGPDGDRQETAVSKAEALQYCPPQTLGRIAKGRSSAPNPRGAGAREGAAKGGCAFDLRATAWGLTAEGPPQNPFPPLRARRHDLHGRHGGESIASLDDDDAVTVHADARLHSLRTFHKITAFIQCVALNGLPHLLFSLGGKCAVSCILCTIDLWYPIEPFSL